MRPALTSAVAGLSPSSLRLDCESGNQRDNTGAGTLTAHSLLSPIDRARRRVFPAELPQTKPK